MKFALNVILLCSFYGLNAQMVGSDVYFKGNYIEFGLRGFGGFEGAYADIAAVPVGYHQRPVNSWFGILANPQMNGWLGTAYDGDFFTNTTPENGWGFEAIDSAGLSTFAANNCSASTEIPGALSAYINAPTYISVDWNGNYAFSGYDLDFHINYNLYKNDLFYTTTVSITNNGSLIPEYYYYRTIDPDNNESITTLPKTINQILSQPSIITDRAQVSAKQIIPWTSVISFVANGQEFKASEGGTEPRDGSDMWNGLGGVYTTDGLIYAADESISLSYKILNFAPGSTKTFHFFTVFADSLLNYEFEKPNLSYTGGGTVIVNDSIGDSVYACGPLNVSLVGYSANKYDWAWLPNTYLDHDTGLSVTVNALDTITYTVTGTPIALGATQILKFTVIPAVPPNISMTLPGPECGTYDLTTLVYSDLNSLSNINSFNSNIPTNAFDASSAFGSSICTPYDTIYLMMADSSTGCFDVEWVNINWEDVLFDLNLTTTSCIANTGSVSISGITAMSGTYAIMWSTGDTTLNEFALPAGPISVSITGPGGCITSATDTVLENLISGYLNSYPSGCGNANGSIVTTVIGASGNTYNYLWNTGDTIQNLTNLLGGFFSVTVSNQDGCVFVDTITVQNLVTTFSLNNAVFPATCGTCPNGNVYTFLSGTPILPVTFLWNTGATTPNLFGVLPGTYIVTATDAVGCTYIDTFFVGYPLRVEDLTNDDGFTVFPNPTNDFIQINSTYKIDEIQLIGVDGNVLLRVNPNVNAFKLDVVNFDSQVYLLRIKSNEKIKNIRFIKYE